jgi:hypothetical protein
MRNLKRENVAKIYDEFQLMGLVLTFLWFHNTLTLGLPLLEND